MNTFKNSFHNTSYTTRKSAEELDAIAIRLASGKATPAEKAFASRMKKTLCGVSGCTCGDEFGRR